MNNVEQTITISLPSNYETDGLVECILYLRILAHNYPEQLDIAYEALKREDNLPPTMTMSRPSKFDEDRIGDGKDR